MTTEAASNYKGKGGKSNIVPQGQTSGAYGASTHAKRREPDNPKQERP